MSKEPEKFEGNFDKENKDRYVKVKIEVPRKTTDEEREAIEGVMINSYHSLKRILKL